MNTTVIRPLTAIEAAKFERAIAAEAVSESYGYPYSQADRERVGLYLMSHDSDFRVKNEGDSTYYRPSREAAERVVCELLAHQGRGCKGIIEMDLGYAWVPVAQYEYGRGITDFPAHENQNALAAA